MTLGASLGLKIHWPIDFAVNGGYFKILTFLGFF
jgi:hypothetical protein